VKEFNSTVGEPAKEYIILNVRLLCLRNSPDCHFRGRIPNLNKLLEEGAIEIIEDHSKTCKIYIR